MIVHAKPLNEEIREQLVKIWKKKKKHVENSLFFNAFNR